MSQTDAIAALLEFIVGLSQKEELDYRQITEVMSFVLIVLAKSSKVSDEDFVFFLNGMAQAFEGTVLIKKDNSIGLEPKPPKGKEV